MCKKYLKAVESYCKGLEFVSSGVAGSCSDCQSTFNMKIELSDCKIVYDGNDAVLQLKNGHELVRLCPEDIEMYGLSDGHALWEEFKLADPDIPSDVLDELFSEKVSRGEYPDEGGFSWSSCDSCGSSLGGDRYVAHGVDANKDIIHMDICVDCLMFFANGDVPEEWE
jgi:hypothetical protein